MTARSRVSVAGLLLAAAALVAFGQGTPERYVFELAAEAPDAQKQGAAEVDAAQKLAKSGKVGEAVLQLEALARRLPASVHDCNLALAYLRAGQLTAAKLAHDLSGLRNGVRPKWCTGDVSTQISDALRNRRLVLTTLDVTPADSLVEVSGIALRRIGTLWLDPGTYAVTISAPGRVTQTVNIVAASPSAHLAVTLETARPALPPDASVAEPMASPDAGAVAPVTADAAVAVTEPPPDNALIKVGGAPVGYRAVALTLAISGWLGAGVLGVLAYKTKGDANGRYKTDPDYQDLADRFDTYKYVSLGSAILGAVATSVYIYFVTQGDEVIRKPGKIEVGLRPDGGFGVSYSGSFGGDR